MVFGGPGRGAAATCSGRVEVAAGRQEEFGRGVEGPDGRRSLEGAELGELGQRSSSGPSVGRLKEKRRGKNNKKKLCGERILPQDGAGRSAAVPVQNSKPPELINISSHLLRQAASLTLPRDPRRWSREFVTAEAVEAPPAPRSSPRRALRAVLDAT